MRLPKAEQAFFMCDELAADYGWLSSIYIEMPQTEEKSWGKLKKRIVAAAKAGAVDLYIKYIDPAFMETSDIKKHNKRDRLIKRLNKFARRLAKKNYYAKVSEPFGEIHLYISWQL